MKTLLLLALVLFVGCTSKHPQKQTLSPPIVLTHEVNKSWYYQDAMYGRVNGLKVYRGQNMDTSIFKIFCSEWTGSEYHEDLAFLKSDLTKFHLYLIYQTTRIDYEVYQCALVIATTPEEAKTWHPRGEKIGPDYTNSDQTWVRLGDIKVKEISENVNLEDKPGIVNSYYFGGQE
jgi:hypothetical protein